MKESHLFTFSDQGFPSCKPNSLNAEHYQPHKTWDLSGQHSHSNLTFRRLPLCTGLSRSLAEKIPHQPCLLSSFLGCWVLPSSSVCPTERKSREENKLLHKTKTILFGTYVMIYPILSSEQEIVCLQLFQAFKIPLYSLCSQLNEDHLGHTREMMSFGPSPPFHFLTVGYSLPEAGQNPCSQSQHYWSESLVSLGYQICKYFSTYFCHSITQDYPLAFTANILSTEVLGITLNICILCVHHNNLQW